MTTRRGFGKRGDFVGERVWGVLRVYEEVGLDRVTFSPSFRSVICAMESLGFDSLALLFAVGVFAGCVDAIAGGGGLISLPMLLSVGLSPAQALATNKLQGSFGTFAAMVNFARKGYLKLKELCPMLVLTFVGSACGTLLVQRMGAGRLVDVIPFLLLAVGCYLLFQPKLGEGDCRQRMGVWGFSFCLVLRLGSMTGFSVRGLVRFSR